MSWNLKFVSILAKPDKQKIENMYFSEKQTSYVANRISRFNLERGNPICVCVWCDYVHFSDYSYTHTHTLHTWFIIFARHATTAYRKNCVDLFVIVYTYRSYSPFTRRIAQTPPHTHTHTHSYIPRRRERYVSICLAFVGGGREIFALYDFESLQHASE